MNRNIGIIIQARTSSSRLPNKILMPFYKGKGILQILISSLTNYFKDQIPIIIATTDLNNDHCIIDIAKNQNVGYYNGPIDDVLQRYIDSMEKYKLYGAIRVCSDNPFIDPEGIDILLRYFYYSGYDYCTYILNNNVPAIKTHIGLFAEAVSLDALERVRNNTALKKYREHVTNFIYENPHTFNISYLKAPKYLFYENNLRLTVDTIEDFYILSTLYAWYRSMPDRHLDELISYIKAYPDILERMKKQIENNAK